MALILGCFLAFLPAVPGQSPSPQAETPCLRIDFFPGLVYEDDSPSFHLAVVGGGEPGLSVHLEALLPEPQDLAAGSVAWARARDPDETGSVRFALAPREVAAAADFRFRLSRADGTLQVLPFRVLRASAGLPALEAAGLGLRDLEGTRCLVRVAHRIPQSDQEWLPVRKALGLVQAPEVPDPVTVLADLPLTPSRDQPLELHLVHPGPAPSLPILEALAQASLIKRLSPSGSLVVFLGSRDVQFGTYPPIYRLGLEAVLQHLEAGGVQDLRLALPVCAPPYQARLGSYREEALDVARIYRATRVASMNSLLWSSFWKAGGEASLLGAVPASEGQQRLAGILYDSGRAPR